MHAFRLCLASLLCLSGTFAITAQTSAPQATAPQTAVTPADHNIHLDISVHSKSDQAAPVLTEHDLTLLDNNHSQALSSFKSVMPGQEPAEIIFVLDAANARYTNLSYQQQQLQNYLRAAGKLPHPATIAVLTDQGVQIQKGFSRDGTELSKLLDGYVTGLRTITRSTGFWGATERLDLSLKAIGQLTAYAQTLPGRKFLFWISPGWPLLSGPRMDLDSKQQQQLFNEVVAFSNQLRTARVTLYDINPFGLNESLLNANYYRNFLKGVHKPKETQIGNLGLQVMAVQSGGQTITTDNDIATTLKDCVGETESWYEVSFPMPPAESPNEYHHLEVKISGNRSQPSLVARTRDGYYAQPTAQP
jgi:VWFA-related protein